jgi:hypothetical protein
VGASDHRRRDRVSVDPVLAVGDRLPEPVVHGAVIGRANTEGEDLNGRMDS